MSHAPGLRPAVRALVIDQHDNVLLVRLAFPHGAWWVLPGGGIEPGETDHAALRRELAEELGLVDAEIGAKVWTRKHMFTFVDTAGTPWSGQSESVYLVRTAHFVPVPHMDLEELTAEHVDEIRWWSPGEIGAHEGPDNFAPRDLSAHLESIIVEGVPAVPFEIIQRD